MSLLTFLGKSTSTMTTVVGEIVEGKKKDYMYQCELFVGLKKGKTGTYISH